jgi:spoIIIJ-associated protein
MEWVETTGRSVEEALDAALDELGVDEDDVEYEVLEEAKAGLFGRLGGNPARVRARVKPVSREKPGERQRRNRRSGSRSGNGSGVRGGRRQGSTSADRGGAAQAGAAPPAAAGGGGVAGAGSAGATTSTRRRRRGGRGRGGSGETNGAATPADSNGGSRADTTEPPRAAREGTPMETMDPDISIEEQADLAEGFTRGLVDAFDLGATVTVTIDDETILVSVDGADIGLLVGPKGATLSAIEELVRTVVQRQTDGHGARINVDVGGYRAKRREALEAFTRALVDKVLESGRAQALEPMSSADRKIVHDTAAEIDGVSTESEGEDPRRRVIIRPTSVPAAD